MADLLVLVLQGFGVALIAGVVGAGELVSRYRDDPVASLHPRAAQVYVAVNAAAGAAVFALIRIFGWTFGASGTTKIQTTQFLVAAFGSMALLRTSLFKVRAGDRDIEIGPAALLTTVLTAADRQVDRVRAKERATTVNGIVKDLSFDKSREELPALCLALMQNVDSSEAEDLANAVRKIKELDASDELKMLTLGLALMNLVGADVLTNAVETLGERIKRA